MSSSSLAWLLPAVIAFFVSFIGEMSVYDPRTSPSRRVIRYFGVISALVWLGAMISVVSVISGYKPDFWGYVGYIGVCVVASVVALLTGASLGQGNDSAGAGWY